MALLRTEATKRLISFSSWRALPGQEYAVILKIAAAVKRLGSTRLAAQCFCKK